MDSPIVDRRTVTASAHSITCQLEWRRCGYSAGCATCPHGPYWYGYWKEGGRTRSVYIGRRFDEKDIRARVAAKRRANNTQRKATTK